MATKEEKAIIEFAADLKYIKKAIDEVKGAVYGNGSKGLKGRVGELEVKFYVVMLLLLSTSGMLIKLIFWPVIPPG